MGHRLFVFSADRQVARLDHDAKDDQWSLAYDAAWAADPLAFALSPALPLQPPGQRYSSHTIRRFIEHLLPEGRAMDVAATYSGLRKGNLFGLIRALGGETTGALRFSATDRPGEGEDPPPREVPLAELDARIAQAEQVPLSVWDQRVRMSVAGLQDKLAVYLDRPLDAGGSLFLVEGPRLASTHLLKPDSGDTRLPHLVINEHYCMSLAQRMGLPVAGVGLLRTPRPVLVVRRFDRQLELVDGRPWVRRRHIIDACQACDLPLSFKYERYLGRGAEVRDIREGMSFELLFGCAAHSGNKALTRLTLLRWALFQFLIGNSDAHGKNFSFYVNGGGLLEPAPWYDLVSALQYSGFDQDLAMAYGDVFEHDKVSPFALADFAKRCGIDRRLLRREAHRLAKLGLVQAPAQAEDPRYAPQERDFASGLGRFIVTQARRLVALADGAAAIKDALL